ncbi:hypothetical protein ABZP36_005891 [Zizania latifolia]
MAPRTRAVITLRYQQLFALLSSATLEWVLVLLLLLEGLLSYLVTTFARVCKLQPPCPMCTRLDHVLGKARPGFYRDLMCNSHKAEASSWAFCHTHQKLVDVHSMCEPCLASFATQDKLGVSIGKTGCRLGFSLGDATEASPIIREDTLCSCCSSPLKMKSYPSVVLQKMVSAVDTEEKNCRCSSRGKRTDEDNYVTYSELKTSDSESEPWHHGGVDSLKEELTLSHPHTETAGAIPPDSIAQDEVVKNSGLIQLQNGACDSETSQVLSELHSFKTDGNANLQLQPPDFSSKSGQCPSEDPDTRDQSEEDVWHNALSSIRELPVVENPAETSTATNELKAELTDRTIKKASFRAHEDLKLLLSQVSSSDCIYSPSIHEQHEQTILNNITRALSLERNYPGISESTANEGEGDCTVDELKQQIELDRKSISLLCRELEEERNASAVATNQTMAMITRLQEEKAAMQMEALQYQRMMGEQREYDHEDLHKMAAMVEELGAELDSYKAKLRDQVLVSEIRDAMRLPCSAEREPGTSRAAASLSLFEDEKAYISKHLRKLRQKLIKFSNNSMFIDASELDDEGDTSDVRDSEDDDYQDAEENAEMSSLAAKNGVTRNGGSFRYVPIDIKGSSHGRDDPKGQYYAMVSESDLVSLEDEISELSGRLNALEADHSFLEHSINSMKIGKDGEELVHGIACSLRELRNMGITWKDYD